MPQLGAEFTTITTFVTHPGIIVRRARRVADGVSVILKRPAPAAITEESIARLSYEFEILAGLHKTHPDPRIITPLQVWGSLSDTTLVLEDIGGMSIADLVREKPLPMEQATSLAHQVAQTLGVVHAAGIIHKDINPRNLIYNAATGAFQLIDFGIAVRLEREVKAADGQTHADGTLVYAPPEQVGRMARHADHSSDYYSLGATLYDLLCGRPPFVEADENKLMHQIFTAIPVPPNVRDPRIPEPLSQLVMRLLEKNQERRYRSISGIVFDLQQCTELLAGTRQTVTLGSADRSERLEFSDKLYGREEELAALHQAFKETTQRRRSLVFLGGPSGMGKSALVAELQAELVGSDALFASGKHDQLRHHMPFSALSQAITGLVRGFLFESEVKLDYWRRSVQAAVGAVGQALIDVVPAIELLIGPQKPVNVLPTQETLNRLHYLLQRLIVALAAERPLLLFLDDLQWADHGTIKLLQELIQGTDSVAGLCVVAAYRDNELAADHPLARLLDVLDTQPQAATQIILEPLDVEATGRLLEDATGAPVAETAELAPVVHAKTHGNPFFARAYLQHLNRQGLLFFDTQTRHFKWDLATIEATSVADNVVNLLAEKLRQMSPDTQRILSTGACLGNQFHLLDLQRVTQHARATLVKAIGEALADGLIVPLSANYRFIEHTQGDSLYKFAHDRVQQAAFELMPAGDIVAVRWAIGKDLQGRWNSQPGSISIFDMLSHLNACHALLPDAEARIGLAQLNLTGAQEAKRAGALAIALTYLLHAHALVGEDAWEHVPKLKRSVELELADNEFLSGHIEAASQRLNTVVEHGSDDLGRAEIDIRRVHALTAAGQLDAALEAGVDGLRRLGVDLPTKPHRGHQLMALVKLLFALGPRKLDDLLRLPEAEDPRHRAVVALMGSFKMAAFYRSPVLFALLALVAPTYTIRYGSTNASSYSLGLLALVLVQLNRYRGGLRFANLSRKSMELRPESEDKGAIEFSATAFIEFIDLTPDAFVTQMHRAYTVSLEGGDPLFGGWAAVCAPMSLLWVSFARCVRELAFFEGYALQRKEPHQLLTLRMVHNMMDLLQGHIDLAAFNDPALRAEAEARRATGAAHWVCIQIACSWLCDDKERGWRAVQDGRAWRVQEAMGEFMMPFFTLYGLLIASERRERGLALRWGERAYLGILRVKLAALAEAGRVNYGGLGSLLRAVEMTEKQPLERAAPLFDEAIARFAKTDFVILRATAMECAGRYYTRRNMPLAARGYLENAAELYAGMGATFKSQTILRGLSVAIPRESVVATVTGSRARPMAAVKATATDVTRSSAEVDTTADFDALKRVCAAATQDGSREALTQVALPALLELCAATRAVISIDAPGGTQQAIFDTAPPGTPLPEQLIAYVWRTRETVYVNEVKRTHGVMAAYIEQQNPHCYACVPAMSRGKTQAVIYLENGLASGLFTAARQASLSLAAMQLGLAFELVLYRDNLAQLAASQAQALREAADRVVLQERESTELQLAGGFAHEMRNALTAAPYLLEMLATDSKNAVPAEQPSLYDTYKSLLKPLADAGVSPKELSILSETTDAMHDIVKEVTVGVQRALLITQNILDYAQASHIIPGSHRVRLKDVCEAVLQQQRGTFETRGILATLDVPDDMNAYITESHAYAIASNLIHNASDAVSQRSDGAQRRIVITGRVNLDQVCLSVEDTGLGISEALRPRIFQPFFSTKGTAGVGLGLGFARKVVTAYGGKLDFESEEGVGTKFELTLPRAQAATDKPA